MKLRNHPLWYLNKCPNCGAKEFDQVVYRDGTDLICECGYTDFLSIEEQEIDFDHEKMVK